jgi:chloride channel protein, CIC family
MTSVLIIVEMTSGYSLILPLMIANMTAYVLARHWRPVPIYEALLEQDDIHLEDRAVLDTLEELKLAALIRPRDESFVSFAPATGAKELLRATTTDGRQQAFPVIDAKERVVGLIFASDVQVLTSEPGLEGVVNASDLMRPATCVRSNEDLRTALELMRGEHIHELPVVDPAGKVIGLIDDASIVEAFLRVSGPKVRQKSVPAVSGFH